MSTIGFLWVVLATAVLVASVVAVVSLTLDALVQVGAAGVDWLVSRWQA